MADVRKELNFCKKVGMRVLGVVENMSGLVVPMSSATKSAPEGGLRIMDTGTGTDRTEEIMRKLRAACPELLDECSLHVDVFKSTSSTEHNPESMAKAFGVPFLGKMPLDREMCAACEGGRPLRGGALASKSLRGIVNAVIGSVS